MTLILKKPTGAKLAMRKTWQPMDPDAAAYITAVETADGQALEEKTKIAIDYFVLGCKADGIWSAIKASCILAGARTLNGALVPLVGAAPTNFNFVSGDYNRKTGLVGDGSTKYLDSNRANNADPDTNNHMSIYISSRSSIVNSLNIGSADASTFQSGRNLLLRGTTGDVVAVRSSGENLVSAVNGGIMAASRNNFSTLQFRANSTTETISRSSQTASAANLILYKRESTSVYSNARLAFYSIGESLDLALLDTRVTALINAFGAAIP